MQDTPTMVVKFSGGHVMVYDCIKSHARIKFVKVDENLNSKNYINLLRSNLLSDFGDGEIFQYDGVLYHTSGLLCMKMFNFWKTGEY